MLKGPIDVQSHPKHKASAHKGLMEQDLSDVASYLSEFLDLRQIVRVWPDLPGHIRVAVKALIQSTK